MTDQEKPKVEYLHAIRSGIRADVYERYKGLKNRGVEEESARNTASAQAACAPYARHRSQVYRRELDALLKPPARRATGYVEPFNWRNP